MAPLQKRRPARGGVDLLAGDRLPEYLESTRPATVPISIATHWLRPHEMAEAPFA